MYRASPKGRTRLDRPSIKNQCGVRILTPPPIERLRKLKKDKRERKMTPEQLQGLLHMRKRAFVQKNGKAYNRKQKHKNREEN